MKTLISLCAFLLISLNSLAQIPNIIPYQGNISDTSGTGYDGTYTFRFRILNQSSNQLWTSNTVSIDVDHGQYSVSLGESGQPAIDKSIWDNNSLYMEIAFNDGVNGFETLSPNVRILPVPFALRAAYADSSANGGGLALGDSLVMRDASGNIRFVINPETGEFRMMNNDTSWYRIKVNSPPTTTINRDGSEETTTTEFGDNGEQFEVRKVRDENGDLQREFVRLVNKPGSSSAYHVLQKIVEYCYNSNQVELEQISFRIIRDTAIDGVLRKPGVYHETNNYNCSTNKRESHHVDHVSADELSRGLGALNVTESYDPKKLTVKVGVGGDEIIRVTDPINGVESTEAKGVVEFKTFEQDKITERRVFNSDGSEATTVYEPNKTNNKHQDIFIWEPESTQQCFAVALTGGDSLFWYAARTGFEFDGSAIFEGPTATQGTFQFDSTKKIIIGIDGLGTAKESVISGGKSITTEKSPKDSCITTTGAKKIKMNNGNITRTLSVGGGEVSESVTDDITGDNNTFTSTPKFHTWTWQTPKSLIQQVHDDSDSIIAHTYTWKINGGPDLEVRQEVHVPSGNFRSYNQSGWHGIQNTKGAFTISAFDSVANKSFNSVVNFQDKVERRFGLQAFYIPTDDLDVGFENKDGKEARFGFLDNANNHLMGFSCFRGDSTVKIYGSDKLRLTGNGQRYETEVLVGNTAAVWGVSDGDTSMSFSGVKTYNYGLGSTNNQFVIVAENNGAGLFAADQSNNFAGFAINTNGVIEAQSSNNNSTLSADNVNSNKNLTVGDSIFANSFLAVNGNAQFSGNVFVNGNISKGGGTFRIDHPQDPDNKYLFHSFIESPDMLNIYNGNIVTNDSGAAVVSLPSYFESLNMEYRYQLTCVGTFAQAIIFEEIQDNTFIIKTDKPNVKVSWQVTGIRKDDYANDNRVVPVVEKAESDKGTRLYYSKQVKR